MWWSHLFPWRAGLAYTGYYGTGYVLVNTARGGIHAKGKCQDRGVEVGKHTSLIKEGLFKN